MKVLRVVGIAVIAIVGLLALAVGVLYALFDGDKIKAEISRTVLEQKQRTLVIAGQPKLSVWPNVGIQLDGVTLSEHASKDEFAALQSARISVALMPLLSKQVQVRALDIEGLKLTLVKKKDGTLNIADLLGQPTVPEAGKPAEPAKPADPLQIDISSIRIANAQLTWRDEKAGTSTALSNLSLSTGQVLADTGKKTAAVDKLSLSAKGQSGTDAFTLALDAPKLSLSPEKSGGEAITLSATLQGAGRNATVNLVLNGVEGNADALKIASLALKLDAKAGDAVVKGQLSSPVAVNVAGQSVVLAKLAGSLDVAHPSMPMKSVPLPINGSLKVDAQQQTAALELATQFDESKIATSVKVAKFAPLVLAFDLDVDKLNVDKYLPPKPAPTTVAAKEAAVAKEAPIDLSALKGHTVNGTIRIGALQVSNLKLEKINAKLALAGGKLEVAPLSLNLYEGSTSGSLSVNANGNAVAIKQALVGVSINPLMNDLVAKDLLEGRGNVALDINTRGDTVTAMKKALGGSASLALKDGAIKGINLAQSLRDIKAKLGQADSTQAANANQKTDFSELTGSFKIANGVAHNEDLAMKSPFIRLGGAGDIDVGAGQMNYLAKATVVASGEGQGGKDLGQLKGLTVPVRLTGPFDALSYKIEYGAMLEDATKAKVEEKKQEIKAKAEEAVRDKAKDLFKGLLGK
ncbi:AsmA family protein [Rhodoferax sp. TS-BS-61-7]|uniref:AsmA family protein n=1 Tax=Rhodoferax sp. TS-BS-61-7 TaxID=2094194 RepID=UPI000CF6CEFD|nr:AsmA family protein [Rhodoferax sp. TS-BS-61-7]PQA77536.1 AsmA family protein [Rhodoferax sp. TS-BS-61-7]